MSSTKGKHFGVTDWDKIYNCLHRYIDFGLLLYYLSQEKRLPLALLFNIYHCVHRYIGFVSCLLPSSIV